MARVLASVIGVVAIICIVIIIFAPHIFSSLFTSIARPFWRIEFSISSGSLKSPEQLLAENERLKNEIEELRILSDNSVFVSNENKELKAMMGRPTDEYQGTSTAQARLTGKKSDDQGSILAAVLMRPPASAYDILIIDIGYDHGVSSSSAVYAPGNILIGKVVDVLRTTSKVKLYSSPEERYDVLVGSNRAPAIAIGRGGGQYEAQVSRESGVKEGDYVSSSGLSDGPFGVVTTVISDPAQPFETILFSPSVNVYELRWVNVRN